MCGRTRYVDSVCFESARGADLRARGQWSPRTHMMNWNPRQINQLAEGGSGLLVESSAGRVARFIKTSAEGCADAVMQTLTTPVMITVWLTHHFARGAQRKLAWVAMRCENSPSIIPTGSAEQHRNTPALYVHVERLTSWLHCTYQSVRLYTYIVCCVIPLF
jgi:hypothetical protein